MAAAGSAPLIASLVAGAGAGALQGLTTPHPNAYTGSVNPQSTLEQLQALLQGTYGTLQHKLSEPVTLPDAVVGDVPSFSGGDLPFSFGGQTGGRQSQPASLPGLNFPGITPISSSGSGTGGATQSPSVSPILTPPDPNRPLPPKAGGPALPPGQQPASPFPSRPVSGKAALGPVRQNFTGTNDLLPSAQSSDAPSDPRMAAIELLRQAAQGA